MRKGKILIILLLLAIFAVGCGIDKGSESSQTKVTTVKESESSQTKETAAKTTQESETSPTKETTAKMTKESETSPTKETTAKIIPEELPNEPDHDVSNSLASDLCYFFLSFHSLKPTKVFIKQSAIEETDRIKPDQLKTDRFVKTLNSAETNALLFPALPGEYTVSYINEAGKKDTLYFRLNKWQRAAAIDIDLKEIRWLDSDSEEFLNHISKEQSRIESKMPAHFLISANNEEYNEKNAQTIEGPFMSGMDYEIKHALSDDEIYLQGGIEWGVLTRRVNPNQKIILRYTSTNRGNIPDSFQTYLEDELKSLERYLNIAKEKGLTFDMIEFGDEFNTGGRMNLKFTEEDVYTYYEKAIKLIDSIMPDTKICMDLIPVYAFNDKVFSPGGGYWLLRNNEVVDNVTFIKELLRRGTPFSVVGIEIQPGAHTYHDMSYIKSYIESLIALGVEVYIWEFWIPGEPIENMNEIYENNKPPEGYSKDWQYAVMKDLLTYFSNTPEIIGFNYMGVNGDAVEEAATLIKDGICSETYYLIKDWAKFTFSAKND